MRYRGLVIVGLSALAGGLVLAPALSAEDNYRHGWIRRVEPGVTVQRATEVGSEEAVPNLPFLPGDRVFTDGTGRAEFQFPGRTVVRLDQRSKLDYAGHDEEGGRGVVLRLWSGSVMIHSRGREFARFEVETPAGVAQALEPGVYRVDVQAGAARLSVYQGEAALDDGKGPVQVGAGDQTWARWGERAVDPQPFNRDEGDEFAAWDGEQEAREARAAANSERYLPEELDAYAADLDQNGRWAYEPTDGYVWLPYGGTAFSPYSNGSWAWTPYGWTWVANERWGWAPYHYGRWGFGASLGWYWIPGNSWGPAWVSWGVGGGYVGWCPLGRHDRPVVGWDNFRGHALARGGAAPYRPGGPHGAGTPGWSFVRTGDLGARDLARRRLPVDLVDPGRLQVAGSPKLRPTRDALGLREAGAVPRTVSTKMTMGDFVRELAVDNQTTIPSPWLRRPRSTPQSQDVPRYDRGQAGSNGSGHEAGSSAGRADGAAAPSAARPVTPWPGQPLGASSNGSAAPPASAGASSEGARRRDADGNDRSRSQGGGDRSQGENSGYRPRSNGGSSQSAGGSSQSAGGSSRPQGESGGYRPHGNGGSSQSAGGSSQSAGGSSRPQGGASRPPAQARPADGGSHSGSSGSKSGGSSSGDHATPRPKQSRD